MGYICNNCGRKILPNPLNRGMEIEVDDTDFCTERCRRAYEVGTLGGPAPLREIQVPEGLFGGNNDEPEE